MEPQGTSKAAASFLAAPRRVPLERPPQVENFTGRDVELQQQLRRRQCLTL
jgi:hypothetical protein